METKNEHSKQAKKYKNKTRTEQCARSKYFKKEKVTKRLKEEIKTRITNYILNLLRRIGCRS